jgi:hypothetical protein
MSRGLLVWFGSLGPAPALGAYPGEDDLGHDYDAYVGEDVSVSGRVVDTAPTTIVAEYGAGDQMRVTVTNLATDPSEGDALRVYGVARPGQTIRAIDSYAVPPSGHLYTYLISFIAGVWVLGRLVRYWRIDTTDWTLTPRDTPLTLTFGDRVWASIRQWRDS